MLFFGELCSWKDMMASRETPMKLKSCILHVLHLLQWTAQCGIHTHVAKKPRVNRSSGQLVLLLDSQYKL
jgi:hypothetical protein